MDKKLTLSLDEKIIERAKSHARSNNTSLSKLIEAYLRMITKEKEVNTEITPLVESLSGVISVDADFNEKQAYTDHLLKKHQ